MEQTHVAYSKTPTLKSKPKPQRWIIADVLLEADKPLTVAEIAAAAREASYKTSKPIEESIQWHLDKMVRSRTVQVSS